jgi:dipeptidyl aminopeptidase/acylaminoacyl peptidase
MKPMCSLRSFVLAAALACSVAGGDAASAHHATSAPYPATPEPAECTVAPLAVAEVMDLLATPVVVHRVATPAPFVIPRGEPADAETSADVVDTLRQVFSCANAGDPLRFTTLFTDDFIREFYAEAPLDQVLGFLSGEPQPLPAAQRRVILDVGEVEILEDGRAGVTIVLDEPDDPRTEEPDYAILEEVDGRWLVDEIHEG